MPGKSVDELRTEYADACFTERALWAEVKGLHPGQEGHNPDRWYKWLAAADRVQQLGRLLRDKGEDLAEIRSRDA